MMRVTIVLGLLIAGALAASVSLQACGASDTGGGCIMVDAGDGGSECLPVTAPPPGGW